MKLLAILLFLLIAPISFAQTPDVLDALSSQLLAVEKRFGSTDTQLSRTLKSVQSDIVSLRAKHQDLARRKVRLSDIYSRSLDRYVRLLDTTFKDSREGKKRLELLTALDEDLKLKLSHLNNEPIRRQPGVKYVKSRWGIEMCPEPIPRCRYWTEIYVSVPDPSQTTEIVEDVSVNVRTKAGGDEVRDYEIWYVTKFEAELPDQIHRFDSLSSPTAVTLPPGSYLIWAKKGSFTTERQSLDVGGKGLQQNRDIDVTQR